MDKVKQLIEIQRTREHDLFNRALKILLYGGTSLEKIKLSNDITDHMRLLDKENSELFLQSLTPVTV